MFARSVLFLFNIWKWIKKQCFVGEIHVCVLGLNCWEKIANLSDQSGVNTNTKAKNLFHPGIRESCLSEMFLVNIKKKCRFLWKQLRRGHADIHRKGWTNKVIYRGHFGSNYRDNSFLEDQTFSKLLVLTWWYLARVSTSCLV